MTSMLGFTSWQIHEFPDAVCRGLEKFGTTAGMTEFPPKGRGWIPFGMFGISLSQVTNWWPRPEPGAPPSLWNVNPGIFLNCHR